jgi:hypothetical protein
VFHRPLALLSGLTVGDYLLWNWSLNGSHDVLSLVSGLTLPPLAIACLWLLTLSLARLIARSNPRSRVQAGRRRARARRDVRYPAGGSHPARGSTATAGPLDQPPAAATTTSSAPTPGELAA